MSKYEQRSQSVMVQGLFIMVALVAFGAMVAWGVSTAWAEVEQAMTVQMGG